MVRIYDSRKFILCNLCFLRNIEDDQFTVHFGENLRRKWKNFPARHLRARTMCPKKLAEKKKTNKRKPVTLFDLRNKVIKLYCKKYAY